MEGTRCAVHLLGTWAAALVISRYMLLFTADDEDFDDDEYELVDVSIPPVLEMQGPLPKAPSPSSSYKQKSEEGGLCYSFPMLPKFC